MKGFFTAVLLLIFFSACKESGVQLAKPSTFVRYFSDGQQDQAVDVLETSDKGYLILSYSAPSNGDAGWINLLKTDLSGNVIWGGGGEKAIKAKSPNTTLQPGNIVAIGDKTGDTGYVLV